jgi:hypothetical protein
MVAADLVVKVMVAADLVGVKVMVVALVVKMVTKK